jgi:tRNA threonylcarbamoyladenosine biosynthesis protein TsaE
MLKWNKVKLQELRRVAAEVLAQTEEIKILLFTGDLGAGKTTLIKAICEELGVEDIVGSPTFSIINEYRLPNKNPVYHFDCYRLTSERQLNEIGIDEYLFSGYYCLVEWPDLLKDLLPEKHVSISLTINGSDRDIEMRIIK